MFEGNRGGAFILGVRLLRIASVGAAVGKGPWQVSGSELLPIWSTDCCGRSCGVGRREQEEGDDSV